MVFAIERRGCRLYPRATVVEARQEPGRMGCNDHQSLFSATFSKHFKLFRTPYYVRYPAIAPKLSQVCATGASGLLLQQLTLLPLSLFAFYSSFSSHLLRLEKPYTFFSCH